jgi:AraC-like DNA-binding protein
VSFQVYIPKGDLKDFVESIHYLSGDVIGTGVAFPRMHQVIIINLGSNFTTTDVYDISKKEQEVTGTVWINGMHASPFMLGNRGTTAMYAIGLKLGMVPYFANLPASETTDLAVEAEHWTSPEIFNLREQLLACPDVQSGFLIIEKYLLNIVRNRDLSNLEKIKWLGKTIHSQPVNEICRLLGVTRKRLRNEATHYFGSSVKSIQGIIRFNQILATIAGNPHRSLSSLHEYYDQSHFINDFKARTGITPLQYKRLCQQFPDIKYTPNFIPLKKETFLQFISA